MSTDTDLIIGFGAFQHRRNLSPNTIATRRFRIYAFALWMRKHGANGLLSASHGDIDTWLDGCDITPSTRACYIGYLAAFYEWAIKADHLLVSPTAMVARPKIGKRLPRPTTDSDLELSFQLADPRMRAWICLSALQGFRCCEMARLRVEDINRASMTIRALGKGDKERVIDLHPDTLHALVAHGIPAAGYVFVGCTADGHIHPNTVSRYIGRFYKSIGSTARAHRNRHWFGTNFYAKSQDILLTRDNMGHSSVATTEIYTQVAGGKSKEVIGALSLVS